LVHQLGDLPLGIGAKAVSIYFCTSQVASRGPPPSHSGTGAGAARGRRSGTFPELEILFSTLGKSPANAEQVEVRTRRNASIGWVHDAGRHALRKSGLLTLSDSKSGACIAANSVPVEVHQLRQFPPASSVITLEWVAHAERVVEFRARMVSNVQYHLGVSLGRFGRFRPPVCSIFATCST